MNLRRDEMAAEVVPESEENGPPEPMLRALFEASRDILLFVDAGANVIHTNGGWLPWAGRTREDVLGRHVTTLVHAEDGEGFARILAEGHAENALARLVVADGVRWVDWRHFRGSRGDRFVAGRDVTARHELEAELSNLRRRVERDAKLVADVLASVPEAAVFVVDQELRFELAAGPAVEQWARESKVPVSSLVGRPLSRFPRAESRAVLLEVSAAAVRGEPLRRRFSLRDRTYEVSSVPLFDEIGRRGLVFAYDVSQHTRLVAQLERERARFETLFRTAPVGLFETDARGSVVRLNPAWCAIAGLEEAAALGHGWQSALHPDDRERVATAWLTSVANDLPYKIDVRYRRPDGSVVWAHASSSALREEGRVVGHLGAVLDITERHAAEQSVRGALADRELLFRELQHRVKNNLQVISSLLRLYASRAATEAERATFEDLEARVMAIALLHDGLAARPDGGVDVRRYLLGVVDAVSRAHGRREVDVSVVVDDLSVAPEMAVPIGLLVNELVTNAYKHAFPGTRAGTIEVALRSEGATCELEVVDDGVGFGPSVPASAARGHLGMLIARSLATQLGGALEHLGAKGRTCMRVSFPAAGRRS